MFDKNMIRVYNHAPCAVSLPIRKDDSILLAGAIDGEYPSMETVTFSELEYMNTHTGLIRTGTIEFEKEEREEIYDALRVKNWMDTCFFENEIDEMLKEASMKNMERVLAIKDVYTIDRIYAHMRKLLVSHRVDVSSRVQTVVENRRKELYEDTLTTRIQLVQKEAEEEKAKTEDVEALVAKKVEEQLKKLSEKPQTEETKAEEKAAPKRKNSVKRGVKA